MREAKRAIGRSGGERRRVAAPVFVVLAMTLIAWACHESPTRPPDPGATDVASTGSLEKKGGDGGGKKGSALYDVVATGAFEFSATMEAVHDNRRKIVLTGNEISLKLQFSADTVRAENCWWTDGYDWDDPEVVALREDLMTYDGVTEGIDFTFFRQTGRSWIRRNVPWTMYCVEEDGTSGGCDATEVEEPDGTLVFELNGSTTNPRRWVRRAGEVGLLCLDQEAAPTVTVRATPVS